MKMRAVIVSVALMWGVVAVAQTLPPFPDQPVSPAPDYGSASAWAATPAAPGVSATVPGGASAAAVEAAVDVFYIHPTTMRSTTRWNQALADSAINAWTDASVIARQASIFNGCCRVFAPRYRQATTLALFNMAASGQKAFDLAYSDVLRAFDYYLAHENKGRPFVLAGHSQGGSHLSRLLADRIDGTPLQRQLVAAYVVGMNVAEGDFSRMYKSLVVCETPTQTGCVVGWNALLPSADLAGYAARSEQRFIDLYGDGPGKTTLCVNPLTFDRQQPVAAAERSMGAVPGEPGAQPVAPLIAGKVAARCERGALLVEPDAALALPPLPGGSMHYHDFGLFYADVRENAKQRAEAFLAARRAAK